MELLASLEELKTKNFLKILDEPDDLKNWVRLYLGIELPFGWIDSDSNGSPGDAIWEAYKTYRDDLYITNPGYIWLSSRDGCKTLSGSILNVLLVLHFKAEIAHLAAVRKQAEKCLEYTTGFFRRIKPYLEAHGRKMVSDSKSKIQILNEDTTISFIDVIIANLAGGNSQRATVGSYDEIDTLTSQGLVGYRESQLIPTRKNNHGPMSIKYSTRKFAFGIFEKEIQEINDTMESLVRWNILDITEKCLDARSLKDTTVEKPIRYAKKMMPLKIYTEEEMNASSEIDKSEFERIELYNGCLVCPLASVCKGKLADRPDGDRAGKRSLFKTIDFTIGNFRKTENEMAEAQLMCWKPTTTGLVYSRFKAQLGENLIDVCGAIELITGEKVKDRSYDDFIDLIRKYEIPVFAGVDFGYTHAAALVFFAVLPSGDCILFDCFASPGLETHDLAEIARGFNEEYNVDKWFCDGSQPGAVKTFRSKGLLCPEFTKDILGGISAIRSQVLTSTSARKLKVLMTENNEIVVTGFKKHHFILDPAGNVTKTPDDSEYADVMDAIRYFGQNIFAAKRRGSIVAALTEGQDRRMPESSDLQAAAYFRNKNLMLDQVRKLSSGSSTGQSKSGNMEEGKKKKVYWDM